MRRHLVLLLALAAVAAGCTSGPVADRVSNPGDAAKDLVSGKVYPKLLLEIDHPPGYGPNDEALNVLLSTLREVTGKTSIDVVKDPSIPAEPNKKYSFRDIEALEREHRDRHTGGDTAVLYVVYVAGGSSEDTDDGRVLGAVYRGTSMVMFKGNIKAGSSESGGLLSFKVDEKCIERAVIVHEFGHAAGLVDLGTPMVRNHEDPQHEGHSSNKQSVMYWAVENTASLFTLFGSCGDIPYTFDADDKADLKALRES